MGLTEEKIKTMGQDKPNKHDGLSGVGTANVQKRIFLEYGDGYGLSYSSKLGSYTEARLHVKVVHG
jgi:sensor histidine kinase YesM